MDSKRNALPPALGALGELGRSYFKLLAAGSRSIHQEVVRLTLLVELFGALAVTSAIAEVMQTGHVGAEYVEYVLRHKRRLVPDPHPLRLGNEQFDAMTLTTASGANAHLVGWGGAHMAHFIEAVSPVLTADQRASFAQRLRDHASHDPSAQANP